MNKILAAAATAAIGFTVSSLVAPGVAGAWPAPCLPYIGCVNVPIDPRGGFPGFGGLPHGLPGMPGMPAAPPIAAPPPVVAPPIVPHVEPPPALAAPPPAPVIAPPAPVAPPVEAAAPPVIAPPVAPPPPVVEAAAPPVAPPVAPPIVEAAAPVVVPPPVQNPQQVLGSLENGVRNDLADEAAGQPVTGAPPASPAPVPVSAPAAPAPGEIVPNGMSPTSPVTQDLQPLLHRMPQVEGAPPATPATPTGPAGPATTPGATSSGIPTVNPCPALNSMVSSDISLGCNPNLGGPNLGGEPAVQPASAPAPAAEAPQASAASPPAASPVAAPAPTTGAPTTALSTGPESSWPEGVAVDCANAAYAAQYNFFCADASADSTPLGNAAYGSGPTAPAAAPAAAPAPAAPPENVVYPGLIPTPYAPPTAGYYDPTVDAACNPANGSPTCLPTNAPATYPGVAPLPNQTPPAVPDASPAPDAGLPTDDGSLPAAQPAADSGTPPAPLAAPATDEAGNPIGQQPAGTVPPASPDTLNALQNGASQGANNPLTPDNSTQIAGPPQAAANSVPAVGDVNGVEPNYNVCNGVGACIQGLHDGTGYAPLGIPPISSPPPEINSLPVGTEVATQPMQANGTPQPGWAVDAQAGPNYGHYIRISDAAASECSGVQDQAGCIASTTASLNADNGLGSGANLDCLHNPSSMGCGTMPAVQSYVPPANTGTNNTGTNNSATHDSAFGGGYQIPGAGGGR
jgi:hypothetical protein